MGSKMQTVEFLIRSLDVETQMFGLAEMRMQEEVGSIRVLLVSCWNSQSQGQESLSAATVGPVVSPSLIKIKYE